MYAQNAPDLPQVLLQLVVRNSDGILVSYVETNQITGIDPQVLNQFLQTIDNKSIMTIDGKKYEVIHWQGRTERMVKSHAMTGFVLYVPVGNSYQTALEVLHNSYQVEDGDTIAVYWTVVRPAG
jgi:hypothetical protein